MDRAARAVLDRYPAPCQGTCQRFVVERAFSGADLWRIDASSGNFCLRAWPAGDLSRQYLSWIHHLMVQARHAGLAFVPQVLVTVDRSTWVETAGRLWDLTTWMPGQAIVRAAPAELGAACVALANLHVAWSDLERCRGPCPGVARRLELLDDWQRQIQAGWQPTFAMGDTIRRAWNVLLLHLDQVPRLLERWSVRPLALQPCLCDIWQAQILFDGGAVSGIVDYGSAKIDSVAGDLARLLGSWVGDDAAGRDRGLTAYHTIRPLSAEEIALVEVLDRTGTILSTANWLLMLHGLVPSRRGAFARNHPAEATRRLLELVERMEKW